MPSTASRQAARAAEAKYRAELNAWLAGSVEDPRPWRPVPWGRPKGRRGRREAVGSIELLGRKISQKRMLMDHGNGEPAALGVEGGRMATCRGIS